MSNETKDSFDRRDFMLASLATVGASAALVASSQKAAAQTATAATKGTVYTGDVIQGKKAISALNIEDLEPGQIHKFYFQGVQMPTGQHWHVSVMVVKGTMPGKRFTLTSGVHGDEMSSIHTVQTVMNQLDPKDMAGSVMAVFDIARPAIESMQRRWPDQGRGIDLIDMNREWPGNENGRHAVGRHAGMLFNRLLRPNTDLAIDYHTGATGMEAGAFNIGDRSLPDVKAMTDLFPIPQIWDNAAYPGVLHNAFVDVGIPCFTPEIGAARIFNLEMIPHFVEGTLNCLKHYKVISGTIGRTAADVGVFIGNSAFPVLSTQGGFMELLVKLHDKVTAGQKVAIQRNTFGEVVAEYTCDVDGEVGALRTDATTEPGIVFMFILFNHTPAEEERSYPE